MDSEDNLTKADKKELKKEERQLKKEEHEKIRKRSKIIKYFFKYSLILLILALIGFGLFKILKTTTPDQSDLFKEGSVHWHAKVDIFICGEYKSLEHLGTKEHHAGLPLFHTHGDNLIHVEGRPLRYSDITLGKYFEAINIQFGNDRIMDKVNSDKCPDGKEGKLTALLNKKPLENPVNKSVKDGDDFEIRFE